MTGAPEVVVVQKEPDMGSGLCQMPDKAIDSQGDVDMPLFVLGTRSDWDGMQKAAEEKRKVHNKHEQRIVGMNILTDQRAVGLNLSMWSEHVQRVCVVDMCREYVQRTCTESMCSL